MKYYQDSHIPFGELQKKKKKNHSKKGLIVNNTHYTCNAAMTQWLPTTNPFVASTSSFL